MQRRLRSTTVATLAVLALTLLAGCDSTPDPSETATVTPDASSTPPTSPTSSQSPAVTTNSAATPTSSTAPSLGPTGDASAEPTATGGPGTYPNGEANLDLSQTHPSGVTVDLTRISVKGNSLEVDVSAVNGSSREIYLANIGDSRAITASIGDAPSLLFRPPVDDPSMTIPSGSELTGTIAFIGRIPPDATSATIVFNALLGNTTSKLTPAPEFTFEDVPLP